MQKFLLLLTLLFFLPIVSAATLYGTVYDLSLQPVEQAVVVIDTVPGQKLIVSDGAYSLHIPVGSYTLSAERFRNNVVVAQASESIIIQDEGSYVLDIILFPTLSEEEELLRDDVLVPEPVQSSFSVSLFTIIIVILLFFLLLRSRSSRKEPDDELKKILRFIKKQGGRVTQKEIRKEFPLSETKISLMVAELEDAGKIKKVKKGRGNIIILQ